ncbi:MAG: DUF2933 domain-containing protein [Betaproteobacteria bacterium]|nr:DUF2933 domain-containing protein [Betaproteobacteria bacterium]
MDHDRSDKPSGQYHGFWQSRSSIAFLGLGLAASFYLLTEHTAHALGILPYLVLLACPLMHLFHHGHHHHNDGVGSSQEDHHANQ